MSSTRGITKALVTTAVTGAMSAAVAGCSLLPTGPFGSAVDPATSATAAVPAPGPASPSGAVEMGLDTACQAITSYQADVATHGSSRDTFWTLVGDLRDAAASNPDLAPLMEPLQGLSPTDLADLDSITAALAKACA